VPGGSVGKHQHQERDPNHDGRSQEDSTTMSVVIHQ
jgi:hypothetical protein